MKPTGIWKDQYLPQSDVLFINLRVEIKPFQVNIPIDKQNLPNIDHRTLDFQLELVRQSTMTHLQNGVNKIIRDFKLRE